MNNNVSKIVEKFLSSLEKEVLDLQLQVGNLKAQNREYDEVESIINLLHESKIAFAEKFLNHETKSIATILEKAIPDKDKLNYYLAEMTNYYYLYETNLLNAEVTKDQTKHAEEALEGLEKELNNYKESLDVAKNRSVIKALESLEEKIVAFGSKFSYIEEKDEEIELELFIELMENSRLLEEEKLELLQLVIQNNNSVYEKKLREKNTRVIKVFEQNQEEVLDELEELTPDTVVAKVDKETLERIETLLKNPDILRKLVKVVAEVENIEINIDGGSYYSDEQEVIDETVEIAKEEIINLINSDPTKTPEEALAIFIETNDDELYNAEIAFEELFGEDEKEDEVKEVDEYLEMIQQGIEFYDNNKKLLKEITPQEKDSIDNYARGLYHNKNNRIIVYKSKTFGGNNKSILKDAAYEIEALLKIFETIENADRLNNEIIIKIGKRINEILESVNEATKDFSHDFDDVKQDEPKKKGTVYFLEKGTEKNRTVYEEEIGIDNYNKGISNSYYRDLLFQLEQIESRGQRRIPSLRPNNSKFYRYTNEFGVRAIASNRIATYYIPVGTDDAIIVGVRFIDTGDGYAKTLEQRLKTYATRIEELIEKIKAGEGKDKADIYLQEIKKILSNDPKYNDNQSNMDEMFAVSPVEIIPPKHM